jgi:hypothetical protein
VIKIAHRGNYKGKNVARENRIDYIEEAIAAGYDVEIDVRYIKDEFWLGHDEPQERIDVSFLERGSIWTHAKNLEAHVQLWHNPKVQVFWHDADPFTFTSKGIKWVGPGSSTFDGIMVMPDYHTVMELTSGMSVLPLGICADDFSMALIV